MTVKELTGPAGMRTLYPRAVMKSVPLVGGGGNELPDTELVLPELEVDRDHLRRYLEVCELPPSDELPATYPHILVFPLAMELMTDRSFPLAVIGMVHIENEIEQTRPLRADERPTLRVRTIDLRPHDKGTQFDVVSEASVGHETVWRERRTYLHREGGGGSKSPKERKEPPEPTETWEVPGDIGRRYGAISGDRNPVHMHPLTARLLGMPGTIAHGMWVLARCLGALEQPAPKELKASFKTPLVIPARVQFATWGEGEFGVHDADSGKPHLVGRLSRP